MATTIFEQAILDGIRRGLQPRIAEFKEAMYQRYITDVNARITGRSRYVATGFSPNEISVQAITTVTEFYVRWTLLQDSLPLEEGDAIFEDWHRRTYEAFRASQPMIDVTPTNRCCHLCKTFYLDFPDEMKFYTTERRWKEQQYVCASCRQLGEWGF